MKKIAVIAVIFIVILFTYALCYAQRPDTKFVPKKVMIDTNYDGKPDRIEYYDQNGQIAKVEIDVNYDGRIDEWITYEKGKPVKHERDTNNDSKPDQWVEY